MLHTSSQEAEGLLNVGAREDCDWQRPDLARLQALSQQLVQLIRLQPHVAGDVNQTGTLKPLAANSLMAHRSYKGACQQQHTQYEEEYSKVKLGMCMPNDIHMGC